MDWFMQPWPWWISGILIGLTVPLLYLLAGKAFGISTSLQQIGAMCAPNSKYEYLRKHDRTGNLWTLVFVIGIALGAFVANRFLTAEPVSLLPDMFKSPAGAAKLLFGGFLIGFGTRYARWLYFGPFDYRNCKSELAQSVGNDLLLCWRPCRHLGTRNSIVLIKSGDNHG